MFYYVIFCLYGLNTALNLNNLNILESTKKLYANSAVLKIRYTGLFISNIPLDLEFSPPIVQGVDYDIILSKYLIDDKFRYRSKNATESLQLRLRLGKSWSGTKPLDSKQVPLYLTKIRGNSTSSKSQNILSKPLQVALIVKSKSSCPVIDNLPGASPRLMQFVSSILKACEGFRPYPSKKLTRGRFSSYSLLEIDPPLMLIDGSDQPLDAAAASVDSFLGAHSVLEIAWEPIYASDPRWWVLVPRPQGMPGHLFAILDAVQWRHPIVARADYYKTNKNCTTDQKGIQHCVPGCPGTKLKRIIASGYNADTKWIAGTLRKAMNINNPFQAAPVKLGWRLTPPQWGGTIGWTYTFQGCASNFLDCFFLDHSPCPPIDVDVVESPGIGRIDKSRIQDFNAGIEKLPKWFRAAVGYGLDQPVHSIGFFNLQPTDHVMYTYLFRPKYRIRQEVQKRVDAFALEKDSCAILHVRRGDSVMHRSQGRAYIQIRSYVAAARPMLDAMNIRTVLLFTDSATAVEESLRCEREFPDVCGGIRFRYIDKKRWKGAEGGWENPFPTQNTTEELLIIQSEFALAQQCNMAILGESGYGDLLYQHSCCGFPMSPRGFLPSRCNCPPKIQLSQFGFGCESGNKILCNNQDVGGNIHKRLDDPTNMLGANYSFTRDAYRSNPNVKYFTPGGDHISISLLDIPNRMADINSIISRGLKDVCKYRVPSGAAYSFCTPYD